jgi:hypothetical protein
MARLALHGVLHAGAEVCTLEHGYRHQQLLFQSMPEIHQLATSTGAANGPPP